MFTYIKKYFLLTLLLVFSMVTKSAEIDWPEKPIAINAQEQSLGLFLKDFFSNYDMQVLVSNKVKGDISGEFNDQPEKLFNNIVKAYGLLPYFDGHAVHVNVRDEVQSRSFSVNNKEMYKIIGILSKKKIVDKYQSVEILTGQGLIKVRGAKEFIYDMEELINSVKKQYEKPKKVYTSIPKVKKQNVVQKKDNKFIFKTFPLKYASAADVIYYQNGREVLIPGVATLLRKMVGDGQSFSDGESVNIGFPERSTVPGLKGKGLRQNSTDSTLKVNHTVNANEGVSNKDQKGRYDAVAANASRRGSFVKIEAERNLNAVIVRDYADSMSLYENLILQLDKEPQLVEIQVTIIDVDKNKLKDIGFDWSYEGDRTSARFGGGDGIDFDGQNGGLLLNTVIGNPRKLFSRIRALAEDGSAKVVSQPQVLTLSNLEAILQNNQSFYVRIAGNEEVDLFNVTAGTSLRVLPQVVGDASDPKIRLLVTIEDGVIVPNASVDDIPIVERSSLSTQAIIYNGENLLLGGLVRESNSEEESKVPVIGDVPGIGNLFKRTNQIESRTERLFLISPKIVGNNRNSRPIQQEDVIDKETTKKELIISQDHDDIFWDEKPEKNIRDNSLSYLKRDN